ncbi:hypothetical protein [Nocardiopsis sp. FR26]|uniref:hypothetical protein n=1 Tax=Nocardiopsis sp. FR26 TaxID=2605987 RepID=UPI001359FA33|nr:hypothetical protein [Nocardiopsis sp. FR26]
MSPHPDNPPGRTADASAVPRSDGGEAGTSPPPSDRPSPETGTGARPAARTEAAPAQPEERWGRSRVTNVFYGMVNAQNGVFGAAEADGHAAAPGAASVTGPLREHEIRAAVDTFAAPERFEEASKLLEDQRVLVLSGASGTGRRTGAIRLLADSDRITVLSPTQTLEGLAARELASGRGYIVLDWFGADPRVSPAEHEYLWSVLLRHVQGSEASLVLTCAPSTPVGAAAPVLAWTRPRAADVVRAHLRRECASLGRAFSEGHAKAVGLAAERLPDDRPVTELVAVARALARGELPQDAVDRVLRSSSHTRVREWFDHRPERRDVTDAAALALLHGIHERDYELLANRLHQRVGRAFPPPLRPEDTGAEEAVPAHLPELRRHRGEGGHGLVRVEYRDDGWMVRRFPGFTEAGDRREVLRQLWERYDVDFWDAVEAWTRTVVSHRTRGVYLARGLAVLAGIAFEEVHDLYLDRWSRGTQDRREACVFVLWSMCLEGHAPAALRTVDRWLSRGAPRQVETALHAWSGELGVMYPTEAVNRLLSRLRDPEASHRDHAAFAVGGLFGSLVERGGSARALLRELGEELADTRRFGPNRPERVLVLTAVCSVLTVSTSGPHPQGYAHDTDGAGEEAPAGEGDEERYRAADGPEARERDGEDPGPEEAEGGDPAIARHLLLVPEQLPLAAELWAETARYRPVRRLAVEALCRTLCALHRSGADAQAGAAGLLTALAGSLRPDEHVGFRSSLTSAARRRDDPFTDAFLVLLPEAFGDGSDPGTGERPGSGHTEKATPA